MSVAPIETIDLPPGAQACGKAFGEIRRERIHSCVSAWMESLRQVGVVDPRSHLMQMLQDTDFLSAIRTHTPDVLEEVRGIAEGAGQPFELILAEQLMDEEWAHRRRTGVRTEISLKCSSAALHLGSGPTWIGQNMDLGGYTDGHQFMLRLASDAHSPGALIFTIGGMVALMGVNDRGVGVCVNALPQLPAAKEGLPVSFMIRRLLQARSTAEASQVVLTIPHATGQHYLIADAREIRSFEASSAGVLEYRSPDPSRIVHTNHPLAAEQGTPYPLEAQINTEARLRSLVNRLMTGQPNLETMKAALSSCDDAENPVCRVPNPNGRASGITGMIGFTTGSMISTLAGDGRNVESWVSNGPPCQRGYTQVALGSGER